jgi:uncharacterized protein (DUF1330 family)
MDPYSKSEPVPEAFARLMEIPAEQPVYLFSLLKFREDRPREAVLEALRVWDGVATAIEREQAMLHAFGASVVGSGLEPDAPAPWHRAYLLSAPSRRSLMRLLSDERMFDAVPLRRDYAGEVLALVLTSTGRFEPVPPGPAAIPSGPGPEDRVRSLISNVMSVSARMDAARPVVVCNIVRYRSDQPRSQCEAAFMRWRAAFEPVAEAHGAIHIVRSMVQSVFIGEPGSWDVLTLVKYRDRACMEAVYGDPRLHEAVHLRSLAIEDSILLVLDEDQD